MEHRYEIFYWTILTVPQKWTDWDFPGGKVERNLPANERDVGSTPVSGKSPHATEQLNP